MIFKFDSIIHLAAQAGDAIVLRIESYLESNILGFQSVLEFVEKTKVERFLYEAAARFMVKTQSNPFQKLNHVTTLKVITQLLKNLMN